MLVVDKLNVNQQKNIYWGLSKNLESRKTVSFTSTWSFDFQPLFDVRHVFIIENQNLDQAGCIPTTWNTKRKQSILTSFAQIAMSAEHKEKAYSWIYCNHTSKILTYIVLGKSPLAPISTDTGLLVKHTSKHIVFSNYPLHLNLIVHAYSTDVIY